MEKKLKSLPRIMDKEMSQTKVFTEKDERQILSVIKKQSKPVVKTKRSSFLIPKLLTAALFAVILFSSYTFIENEVKQAPPKLAEQNETPNKPIDENDFPFIKTIEIEKKNGQFYLNGVTLGMTAEETFHTLKRPYDEAVHSKSAYFHVGKDISDYEDSISFNFSEDEGVTFISVTVRKSNEIESSIKELGEPYFIGESGLAFYYDKNTNQVMSVALLEDEKFFINMYYKNEGDPF